MNGLLNEILWAVASVGAALLGWALKRLVQYDDRERRGRDQGIRQLEQDIEDMEAESLRLHQRAAESRRRLRSWAESQFAREERVDRLEKAIDSVDGKLDSMTDLLLDRLPK